MTEHQEIPLTETHHCSCGESNAGLPELDVRTIPHAIRHGAVIGAFAQLQPGASMVLIAPHNPLPLLSQLEQINGSLGIEYLTEGPEEWHIKLTKQA
ncbi:DUF2249 domain-containing protein [Cutibacterium avidum]|uniref:DUF2249 domain-containing protein n=1 Tax=Cutibacterium avidum TaxID=33010 RepID=UPI00083E9117|nr:DUF2249 domain-containing protein [Cutibacterium avidum]AOG28127.1 hemerythrin [Cutibacterium avidum]